MFGRLTNREGLRQEIMAVGNIGALLIVNEMARTVEARLGQDVVFRALDKGNGIFVVMLNEKFYIPTDTSRVKFD